MDICEVTTTAPRDRDLLADSFGMLQDQDFTPTLASFNRAKKTGGPPANDYDVPLHRKFFKSKILHRLRRLRRQDKDEAGQEAGQDKGASTEFFVCVICEICGWLQLGRRN